MLEIFHNSRFKKLTMKIGAPFWGIGSWSQGKGGETHLRTSDCGLKVPFKLKIFNGNYKNNPLQALQQSDMSVGFGDLCFKCTI